ncbi:hypothetical protein CQR46_0257 [Bifidobacterium pseudolongum subsp. globosum]|uniref:Uncharacterized protein n=1 Tax=Bifidobacterium pseudolongum subsp. globosum TaxID=1690 RepID=A0A2N3QKG5_9BIFI|nr:hypothetical protein CQR46_0257 [Bifidobacterium pseudolongum subsp. globosum]
MIMPGMLVAGLAPERIHRAADPANRRPPMGYKRADIFTIAATAGAAAASCEDTEEQHSATRITARFM